MSVKAAGKVGELAFVSTVSNSKLSETNALLLAESIRAFAGSLSQAPIWYFTPGKREQLSTTARSRLSSLNVTLIPFEIDPEAARFPFTCEANAAALAENMALDEIDLLSWLNANTMVIQESQQDM